jgi:hypothetical protein
MAAAGGVVPVPGFSPDNKRIVDPVAFLESVLEGLDGVKVLFDRAAAAGAAPIFSEKAQELGNLRNGKNSKTFQTIPVMGMVRLSTSTVNNCCFFDSFLTSMSPKYRTLPIDNRPTVFNLFRRWCANNTGRILAVKPEMADKLSPTVNNAITNANHTNSQFVEDVQNLKKEIETNTGWIIGWYFGVNVIYIYNPLQLPVGELPRYNISCQTAYQSPECKTVIIRQGVGHFEPIGVLGLTMGKYNEATSTFLFDWTDKALCALKVFADTCDDMNPQTVYKKWEVPVDCEESPSVIAARQELINQPAEIEAYAAEMKVARNAAIAAKAIRDAARAAKAGKAGKSVKGIKAAAAPKGNFSQANLNAAIAASLAPNAGAAETNMLAQFNAAQAAAAAAAAKEIAENKAQEELLAAAGGGGGGGGAAASGASSVLRTLRPRGLKGGARKTRKQKRRTHRRTQKKSKKTRRY